MAVYREVARGARSAVILVPGIDRVAAVGALVPPLLAELREAGVQRTRVFLATGTHEHRGLDDVRALLGGETFAAIEPVIHDPRGVAGGLGSSDDGFAALGRTTRGTPVDRAAPSPTPRSRCSPGASSRTTSPASVSEERLVPGAASARTIFANHRLTLARESGIASGIGPCNLDDNPVHLDMVEAARLVPGPAFCLNVLLDSEHRLVSAYAGNLERAHLAACEEARALHQQTSDRLFDGVITSAGGAPYDCNFVQALKALFDVQTIVRPGGAVLCLAECPQGIARPFVE